MWTVTIWYPIRFLMCCSYWQVKRRRFSRLLCLLHRTTKRMAMNRWSKGSLICLSSTTCSVGTCRSSLPHSFSISYFRLNCHPGSVWFWFHDLLRQFLAIPSYRFLISYFLFLTWSTQIKAQDKISQYMHFYIRYRTNKNSDQYRNTWKIGGRSRCYQKETGYEIKVDSSRGQQVWIKFRRYIDWCTPPGAWAFASGGIGGLGDSSGSNPQKTSMGSSRKGWRLVVQWRTLIERRKRLQLRFHIGDRRLGRC